MASLSVKFGRFVKTTTLFYKQNAGSGKTRPTALSTDSSRQAGTIS